MDHAIIADIRARVRDALGHDPVVLAVSGGLDSMVLLDAAAAAPRPSGAALLVATLDHGTGPAATQAVAHVAQQCRVRDVPLVTARAEGLARSEDAWRRARMEFLHRVAAGAGARIATAHHRDDQVETVLFRLMRGSSARGLAALAAPAAGMVRPLLSAGRAELALYARARSLCWIDDPTNASREFTRNRLRHDLLPVLRRAWPGADAALDAVGAEAAAWRADTERAVDRWVPHVVEPGPAVRVDLAALRALGDVGVALAWPVLASRAGVALDHRGTRRLCGFTTHGRTGARIPLSGGWQVVRTRRELILGRAPGVSFEE
jgi:tRNA(Ile)-lysidine synthase